MKVLIISVIILFFANSLAFSQYNTDSSFKYISKYKYGNIKSEGNLLYGVEDGLWKFYNEDGKIIQSAYFYEGTLNGKVEKFYENGQKMIETYYYYGLQVSKYNEWYENGKPKIKGFYKSAFKDSLWTYYNEKGNKTKQELYDYRVKIPMLLNLWDKSGTQTVTNGTGYAIEYYATGEKKSKGEHTDGNENGKWTYWYANEQKFTEGTFKDGKRVGSWTSWYKTGEKRSSLNYDNGDNIIWFKSGIIKMRGKMKDGKKD